MVEGIQTTSPYTIGFQYNNTMSLEDVALKYALTEVLSQPDKSAEDRSAFLSMLLMHIVFGNESVSPSDRADLANQMTYNSNGVSAAPASPAGAGISVMA